MGPFSSDKPANSASLADASAAPSPPARSLFSRLSLPLRSRSARSLTDFHIRAADPHRKYSAGDHVQGAVVLTILKPVRITHLTVALHGYVRVYKTPHGAANEPPINPADISSRAGSKFKYLGHGFASLFEDEQVLSADGRLEPGRYEFNFDLMFPDRGLPSSIDFERGTISYIITATLTRPTSVAPTTSCERKIYLMEKVDIGSVKEPRTQTIYLEPIPRKSRKKKLAVAGVEKGGGSVTSDVPDIASVVSENDSTRAQETSFDGSAVWQVGEDTNQEGTARPMSPLPSDLHSEFSADSAPTTDSTGQSGGTDNGQKRDSGSHQTSASRVAAVEARTITTTIELLRGGCLPGDMLSVRILVQHIKRIKSMHGVIVTLYRQGRIDSSPPLALFQDHISPEEAKRLEREEYYPKSRTGLGGLSLSSAGSCSLFRKDLSQAFSPLIIDPVTLTASVTTSVRVPEDVFPTIKGIPGELISFKYHVEVIVDLGGKLASQIQSGQSGRPGGIGPPQPVPLLGNPYEGSSALSGSWAGGRPIDTDRLRREKGVISVSFEVVVGTEDTARKRGKGLLRGPSSVSTRQVEEPSPYEEHGNQKGVLHDGPVLGETLCETPRYEQEFGAFPASPSYASPDPSEPPAPFYVPPPQVPRESGLTEKERIRQAEQRLLPSQPDQPSSSMQSELDGQNIYDAEDEPVAGPSTAAPPPPPPLPLQPSHPGADEGPSAPTADDLSTTSTTDDKQELERQRLLAEASAPPEFPEDYDDAGASSPSAPGPSTSAPAPAPPSAPALGDDDHYGPQYAYQNSYQNPRPATDRREEAGEELPRYER